MKNLFVVETPLQLVNAIEAKLYFTLKNNLLVILYSAQRPKLVFKPLLQLSNWDEIEYFNISDNIYRGWDLPEKRRTIKILIEYRDTIIQFLKRTKLDRMIRTIGKVNFLFIGNYLIDYMRYLANRINHSKLFLLDDGTDTLRINKMRNDEKQSEIKKLESKTIWKKIKEHVRYRFIDWNYDEADKVNFFTSYDLKLKLSDRLVKNRYGYMKSLIKKQRITEEIFFLGEPLVEDGYIELSRYYFYLTMIIDYFGLDGLYYIPHPRESDNSVASIAESLGINIKRFNMPVEIQLITGADRPSTLCSFMSSALDNCRLIFDDSLNIKAFLISKEDLRDGYEFVAEIYEYLAKQSGNNFEVVKIN